MVVRGHTLGALLAVARVGPGLHTQQEARVALQLNVALQRQGRVDGCVCACVRVRRDGMESTRGQRIVVMGATNRPGAAALQLRTEPAAAEKTQPCPGRGVFAALHRAHTPELPCAPAAMRRPHAGIVDEAVLRRFSIQHEVSQR